ncbi:MAG: helix-turn-helix transcriptional regulator [Gammaproteobacteria bacterium]|nr:helix-turn-helix transcriptional regulator [Gammaproteobacteria bacterium]MBT5203213.1 helix-turn-helix transcriptional regulator [Gammaproteobacteria bacterium]MBT5603424.1 helix-turn-helix transcriptional regulator [Gammaproteobacteria bacterium]MBT6244109.1 helix-turn-helix transcriptional regulator [Gammaproteobacteria bacterium]
MSKKLSNNIRKLRFDADEMSQQTLADKVGVTRQTVFAIEKDKYSPSLEVAFKISNVFRVPLEDVFSYE